MTRRIVDGYLITESDTRVTARPITDADRYAFLKTLHNKKRDRIMYAEPDSWDAVIDNMMGEQKPSEPKPDSRACPHSAPFMYCPSCVVSPCPIGLGGKP